MANTGFQTVYNYIGLEPKLSARCYASVIWNSGKWNSVKWNETRRIGAIFACFCIARVWQRQHQLGFLVSYSRNNSYVCLLSFARRHKQSSDYNNSVIVWAQACTLVRVSNQLKL